MKPKPRYQPGDKIGGRYQVHQALMGGMGEVYLCLDLEQMYPVALKTFQQRYLTNPQQLRVAFEQEVSTWVALEKHPNIVRCFYMDIIDNQPFMILEWIAGEESKGTDLRSWLRHDPLDLQLGLEITIDICRGLIHAQEKQPGLVHRDLKPENILITQGRLAKITDFGLVQIVQAGDLDLETSNSTTDKRQSTVKWQEIVGTPAYMAPEQWLGKSLDARADIYAIGCILYEILTGYSPFQANGLTKIRHQHFTTDIPTLLKSHSLSDAINTLLICCLTKQPENRFATIQDFLQQVTIIYQSEFSQLPKALVITSEMTVDDYNNRGGTYDNLQHFEKALTDYNQAIQFDANYVPAYLNRGVTHLNLQQYKNALVDFKYVIQLNPEHAKAFSNIGVTYTSLGRYKDALKHFSQAIKLDPNLPQVYYSRGLTYRKMGRYDKAIADYSQAIQLDPNYVKAYYNRGNIHHEIKEYDKALKDFNQAIQLDPDDAIAYNNRGLTYYHLQKYKHSLTDYDQAIQLEPTL